MILDCVIVKGVHISHVSGMWVDVMCIGGAAKSSEKAVIVEMDDKQKQH